QRGDDRQRRQTEHPGDVVPQTGDALIVDRVDDEVDGGFNNVPEQAPNAADVVDRGLERANQPIDDSDEEVENWFDDVVVGALDNGAEEAPHVTDNGLQRVEMI